VFDNKVIGGQYLCPSSLPSGKHFGGLQIFEVLVIALHQDLMLGTFEVVSPLFHRVHDHWDLPIVRVVVLFGSAAFSGVEVERLEDPESVELIENAGDCEAAGIGLQNDWLLQVEMLEDQCVIKGLF
jgi:hypothetical protein